MAILITGVAGFIGFHVSRQLLGQGYDVVGIDNLNDYYSVQLKSDRLTQLEKTGDRFRFIKVDFARHEALEQALAPFDIDRIVHLGAHVPLNIWSTHRPPRSTAAIRLCPSA
jgi:UDP-glucuronate 4-epimerase